MADEDSPLACSINIEVLYVASSQKYCLEFTKVKGDFFYFIDKFKLIEKCFK